jgi:hypothetical protein
MATGRSDIVQACGRILRRVNPNIPLIIDFQDSIEGLVGQAKKRELYYRKKKYTVKRCEAGGEYAVKRYEAGGESTDMQKFMFIDDD